jgi:hypothetical protein
LQAIWLDVSLLDKEELQNKEDEVAAQYEEIVKVEKASRENKED